MVARLVGWRGEGEAPRITVVPEPKTPALGRGERAVVALCQAHDGLYEARIDRAIEGATNRIVASTAATATAAGSSRRTARSRPSSAFANADAPARRTASAPWPKRCRAIASALPRPHRAERLGRRDRPPRLQPDRHPHARHSDRVSRGRAGRGGARPGRTRSAAGPICARCRWSPSTARTRATSTTRCMPSPIDSLTRRRAPPGRRHRRRGALRPATARRWTTRRADRGNSVYFPDRVVPMLPEALSNELCSLEARGGPRAASRRICWIDAHGKLVRTGSCAD